MNQFINDRDTVVTDALDGVVAGSGGRLARLDGFPHIKVVVRADWDGAKVALVSGGGSGHEPAHAGFVGKGMLTAAVCGEVFSSPSIDAVVAGILAVTGDAGCLLIVKNYTGDRLNFGLAAERARALGRKVRMVVVDDDVAIPELPQQRGLAGTLLVHKIAGALAEAGKSLDAVTAAAQRVIEGLVTIGMSLDTCTVPGSPKEQRIAAGHAELGLGIHGEAGIEQVAYTNARDAMAQVIGKLSQAVAPGPKVALLNNLGGATGLEMSVLANELLRSEMASHIRYLMGPASLMTALDMHGFSVSLLAVSPSDVAALQAPTDAGAWPGLQEVKPLEIRPLSADLEPAPPQPSIHPQRRALIAGCCRVLISAEAALNALDAKSGDGDTGTTLATAARALSDSLDRLPLADAGALCRALSGHLSQSMGGSSGVLLAIFFAAAGDAFTSGAGTVDALNAGLLRVQEVGGAREGDRTLVDALRPALDALASGRQPAAVAARQGADRTATITRAKAGRATYISAAQLAGHNDPGAEAVARLFEHLAGQAR